MDIALGMFFSFLRSHAKGGSTANCEYIANRATDDIIILGSSRATHHYIPQIIEDSLGLSCYNCGEEGNGIVLAYGRFKMLTSRYKPKLVIYEMTPGYDYGTQDPNTKYLGYLRPYYEKEGIKPIFDVFDNGLSCLKMRSKMYQNTSKLLPNLLDNLTYRDNIRGYAPLFGSYTTSKTQTAVASKDDKTIIDSLKLSYVEKLIVEAKTKNIPLVFMISPQCGAETSIKSYEPEINLCKEYDIPFFNYINYNGIADNQAFFQDISHMNNNGAIAYTQMLVKDVLGHIIKGTN
jgi:hypothetical protein